MESLQCLSVKCKFLVKGQEKKKTIDNMLENQVFFGRNFQ